MTFSKEQLSQAFIDVLTERVPDFSDMPDHVFSERFEKKMDRLIRREAAHPWAVSHTLTRNLIAAAIVIILLFIMCMSVGAIRNSIFKFFQQHFEAHDDVIFEMPKKMGIEQEYVITNLPEGFLLKEEEKSDIDIIRNYENEQGDLISLNQELSYKDGIALDNEHSQYNVMEIDGHGIFISTSMNKTNIIWEQDGYVFLLILKWENVSIEEAITILQSIRPAD